MLALHLLRWLRGGHSNLHVHPPGVTAMNIITEICIMPAGHAYVPPCALVG